MATQKSQNRKKISQGSQESHQENLLILLEIQQRASGPGESTSGATYLSLIIHPKSCCNFTHWFRESCSWSIVVTVKVGVEATSPGVYQRKRPNWQAHLELCHRNPDILERVLNQIALSKLTLRKCAPVQVINRPEHGRTSTTKEQK